jgi:hypothetical protein
MVDSPDMRCVAAALLIALAAGCGPSLTIVSWEPGSVAGHGARTIVLVDGEGATGPREIAAKLLVRESRGGWFRVEQFPTEVKLTLIDERAETVGAPIDAIAENALWGRVDVVEWETEDTTVEEYDDDGNAVAVPAQSSEVTLQISVVDRNGRVILREQQYAGEVVVEEGTIHLDDPLIEAARDAAQAFLTEAAPQQVRQVVRLDDSDGGLIPAVENITKQKWTLRTAERKIRRYLKLHPNNAIATYNIAVLVDAQGRHAEALPIYDEAMKINTRDFYIEARAGCARRATAKRAVFGESSPPNESGDPTKVKAPSPSRGSLNDDAQPVGDAPAPIGDPPPATTTP